MKTKTKISLLLVVIAAALIVVNALVILSEDRSAPVISFPSETVSYSSGMTDSELLEGVTASDNRDGDVTDSLRVGEILTSDDGSQVTVVYVARDAKNNIAQSSRVMEVKGSSNVSAPEYDSDSVTEPETTDEEMTDTNTQPTVQVTPEPETEQTAEADANAAGMAENEAAIAALQPNAPIMYLTQYAVTVAAGSEFDALSYVENIEDDADSRDDLYMGIQINGSVDTAAPGTYELYYYVIDNDGNMSNQARLVVTVA